MKIPPKYIITPEILDLLAKIEANKMYIASKEIAPLVRQKIERVSLLKSALYSAKIEGNMLEETNFDLSPKDVKKLEILNLQKAIDYIKMVKTGQNIDLDFLLTIQNIAMENIIPSAGKLRKEMWAVFNSSGNPVFVAPPPSEINKLIEELITFINSNQERFPLVLAMLSHLILEKIHPFEDGNGRVGRLLIYATLNCKGYEFGLPVVLEEEINNRRNEYYYQLDRGLIDVESYLIFMLEVFYNQTEKIKEQLFSHSEENPLVLSLSPRQGEIYQIIKEHHHVSLDFIQRRFVVVPARTLRYDLKKLQEKNLIIKTSSTRGALYKAV